jgi:ubiquinone/menaquinone biosynthesis C-methylase UbiE
MKRRVGVREVAADPVRRRRCPSPRHGYWRGSLPEAVVDSTRPDYTVLARYYDQVYAWKDYAGDVRRIRALARRKGRPHSRTLLDVGCGTGTHLLLLKRWFRCTGLDRSPEMLRVARRKSRDVRWVVGDMERFELGEQFDVVTCLFGAIGYARTIPRLRRTLRGFARHLRPGGLLVIDPWMTPDSFRDGHVNLRVHDTADVKIARIGVSRRRGRTSTVEFGYVIGTPGGPVRMFRETHRLGLFTVSEQLAALEAAGFRAQFLRRGFTFDRGLFVGVLRADSKSTK